MKNNFTFNSGYHYYQFNNICIDSLDLNLRVQWYKDMMNVFNKYNIAWSHWNYKNDFAVVTEKLEPITEIIEIMNLN